ncbi:cob(I)yrinic acid a,c-diamide adenosyltransferase [Pleomorphomonas sp. NRK KF1]|uniref:cob(I)yrinic acid a,c-diamide adenosyltransferase n=1 Tax=Pleomorphomonas sp. NRK KF1 TaxID=2943000 RepID=UPI002043331A|nr:cob(I)yrinic acid a,c-diamide adenosyltransferase [Pleomorphomonas sp. NRK KF1]MCM5554421.1 cob(I)yrinic acid a,c-diamide adenosyltransferase [Pleomorphomonas sp. NRK KF1]
MVRLNRIYTRTGDDGSSGLSTGERRLKNDPRFEAIGSVDETNAAIGVARLHVDEYPDLDLMLGAIQNDLFDLGADLATPEADTPPAFEPLRILPVQVERLEKEIDYLNRSLAPLTTFVLPGGSAAAAHLHVARTVCRRAERVTVTLARTDGEPVNPEAVRYLNRLSDFLFVASRWANDLGGRDVLWVPGQNRE